MIAQPLLGKAIQGLNDLSSAAGDIKLGTLLASMIAAHNILQAEHDALITQYQSLLAHMDTGNVTGLGNQHVTNYSKTRSPATATSPTVGSL